MIPLNRDICEALAALLSRDGLVIRNRYGQSKWANSVTVRFHRLYASLGFKGASSHSGRRTFITRAARKIVEAGGSLRDVQHLARHADLSMTARYIEEVPSHRLELGGDKLRVDLLHPLKD